MFDRPDTQNTPADIAGVFFWVGDNGNLNQTIPSGQIKDTSPNMPMKRRA
ncbi:hypothetical protein [Thalassospira sp.]|nr:hypothetical protein [Thalassospira sp.]MBO6809146.1 hypothetical protein [Thalassospira sp.]